jgi:ABC-type nitrate/sulfonate/bicarbonate transport system substrate-binding protein
MNQAVTKLLLAGLILAALIGCRRRVVEPTLDVGIIAPSFDYLPLKIAEATGGLKGLALNWRRFNSGWELGEALVASRIDVAIVPFTYVISAVAQGSDVRIVACLEHEDDGIIARPGITRLEELAGRKIGCLKASTIELLLRQTLDARGIRADIVYFSSPMEMWAALEQGAVDALSYYVPGIIKADKTIGNIIHWYSNDWPMHPCCDIAVHAGRIQNKKPSILRLIRAIRLGAEVTSRDPALACSIAVQTYGLSDSVARECLRRTPFRVSLSQQETAFELNTAALMQELGYLARPVDPKKLYLAGLVAR